MSGAALEAIERAKQAVCSQLGHRHRHGDDHCPCGLLSAYAPDGTEVGLALDLYLELAADALCAQRNHSDEYGVTGYSWRDGTCTCDMEVRTVLEAIAGVAAHIDCRQELDRFQRQRDRLQNHLGAARAALAAYEQEQP